MWENGLECDQGFRATGIEMEYPDPLGLNGESEAFAGHNVQLWIKPAPLGSHSERGWTKVAPFLTLPGRVGLKRHPEVSGYREKQVA